MRGMLGDMERRSSLWQWFGLTLGASIAATTLAACEDAGPEHRPKADLCLDAKPWTAARKVIKRLELANFKGDIARVSQPSGVSGNPTFLEIGNAYPNRKRLNVVIWGKNAANFDDGDLVEQFRDEHVCVNGEDVELYKGVPQITIYKSDQIVTATEIDAGTKLEGLPEDEPVDEPEQDLLVETLTLQWGARSDRLNPA